MIAAQNNGSDSILMASIKSDWETPGAIDRPGTFFYNLHAEFNFDLDAACYEMNAKLPNYLTEDDDALGDRPWPGKRAFCNPPYGKGNVVGKWMEKFALEAQRRSRESLVALVTARTETSWFHDIVWTQADEIRFIRGRLLFEINGKPLRVPDKRGVMRDQPATFPSAVIVFRRMPMFRTAHAPHVRSFSNVCLPVNDG